MRILEPLTVVMKSSELVHVAIFQVENGHPVGAPSCDLHGSCVVTFCDIHHTEGWITTEDIDCVKCLLGASEFQNLHDELAESVDGAGRRKVLAGLSESD